jgi:hypothetical protein
MTENKNILNTDYYRYDRINKIDMFYILFHKSVYTDFYVILTFWYLGYHAN